MTDDPTRPRNAGSVDERDQGRDRGTEQEHAERGVPHPPPEGDAKGTPSDDRLDTEVSHGREGRPRPN